MPTDVSRSRLSGVLVPNQSAELWASASSYTQAGPRPGVPDPTNTTAAVLASSGTMTAAQDVDILTSRGGFAGADDASARFVWKNASESATQYRGWNPPQAISGWEAALWTDASGDLQSVGQSHAVALEDGTIVAVAQIRDDAFPTIDYRVEAVIRNATTGVWGRVLIYAAASAPSPDYCPCLVVLPSGRILCYFALTSVTGSVYFTNLRMMYSDDSGATWAFGAGGVLDTDYNYSSYEVKRIRAAYSNGQILLVVHKQGGSTPNDRIDQFASSDLGNSFSLITTNAPTLNAGFQEIVVTPDGTFVLIYLKDTGSGFYFRSHRLGSAFYPFTNVTAVINDTGHAALFAESGGDMITADLAATIDEAGVIYVYAREATSKEGIVQSSTDGGLSWFSVGTSDAGSGNWGLWWNGAVTADYPNRLCAVAWRGSVLMLHGWVASTGNEDDSLGVMHLGGYTSVCLPQQGRYSTADQASGWENTWLPIEKPDDMGWTGNGAGTASLDSPGELRVYPAGADTKYYSYAPTGNVSNGMIVRFRLRVAAGAGDYTTDRISVLLQMADGISGSAVVIRFQASGWRMYDAVSAALIGTATVDLTDETEFLIAIGPTDAASWYRTYSSGTAKLWTAGPTSAALTDSVATLPANAIEWGSRTTAGGITNSYWQEFHHVTIYTGGGALAEGQTNPTDLLGRNFAPRPVYVDGGLSLTMTDGPTFAGDSWSIATRYDYPLTNALDVTSPRQVWRSTSTAAQVITLRWDDSLDANAWPDRSLMGISLLNTNVSRFTIEFLYQDAPDVWYSFGTANTYEGLGPALRFTRDGNTVRPNASTNSTQMPYCKHGEFVGATFSYSTTSSRRILRNSEGGWRNAASVRLRPIVVLDGAVGGDAASGTAGAIIPRDVTVLVDMVEFPYSAIRITIPTTVAGTHPPPAESYYQIGSLVFGSVYAFGLDYAWGRTIDTEPGTEVTESRDRTRRSRVASPARRTVEVSWTDGADLTNVSADEADPDYILGSSDAKAEANASRHGTPTVLEGLIRELDGAHRPLVYLPRFAETSGVRILNRREEMVYARIDSPLRVEVVQGEELRDEVVRVAQVVLVEEL